MSSEILGQTFHQEMEEIQHSEWEPVYQTVLAGWKKPCYCGTVFFTSHPNKKYCSDRCGNRARVKRAYDKKKLGEETK